MRQIKITAADVCRDDVDDCWLAPDDPIHDLKRASVASSIVSYAPPVNLPKVQGSNLGELARINGIQPGTEQWFRHWFGKTR